jgi:hypothetical protein
MKLTSSASNPLPHAPCHMRYALCAIRYALSVRQQQPYLLPIRFVNNLSFAEGTFSFGRFFGQNMAGTGFFIDNFSRTCFSKSLCSRSICFYLRHLNFSFILKCSTFWIGFFYPAITGFCTSIHGYTRTD